MRAEPCAPETAAVGLSYGAASLAFHAAAPAITGLAPGSQARVLAWIAAVTACGVLKSAVNKVLVMTAVKGVDPAASVRTELFSREPLFNDTAELSDGVMVTQAVTGGGAGSSRRFVSRAMTRLRSSPTPGGQWWGPEHRLPVGRLGEVAILTDPGGHGLPARPG